MNERYADTEDESWSNLGDRLPVYLLRSLVSTLYGCGT